jgi:pentatricopeptide repeat protein
VLDRGTCQAVLNVAAAKGSIGLATHMWSSMKSVYGYPPTAEAYGAMIHAFGKASADEEGVASVEDCDHSMMAALLEFEAQGLGPASRGIICSMAAYLATSEQRTDAAYFLLKDFHEEWKQHHTATATSDSSGGGDDAPLPTTTSGESGAAQPADAPVRAVNVSAVNAVIRACALQQSIGRAFETFDEIRNTFGLEPDLGSYNAVLDACSQRRFAQGPAALALLEDIKSTPGLEPDAESYHLTLLALVRSGNLVQADELIERMGYQDIEVGAQTLHQIAHYHLNCGNLDPAMAIVRDLEATGDVIPFHLSKRLKEWDS